MRILDTDFSSKYGVWTVRVLREYSNGAGLVYEFTFVVSTEQPDPDPYLASVRVYHHMQQSKASAPFPRAELDEAQNTAVLHLHELLTTSTQRGNI